MMPQPNVEARYPAVVPLLKEILHEVYPVPPPTLPRVARYIAVLGKAPFAPTIRLAISWVTV